MSSTTPHPATVPVDQLLANCQVTRTRRSGPGGQHRNKVETAIVLEHLPTGIIGQASEKRSQERNREAAIGRLRINLAVVIRSQPPPEKVSSLWRSRTTAGKLRINQQHFDYASALAEALDFVWKYEFELSNSADVLGITTSQLAKFLRTCPAAFLMINKNRSAIGKSRLR